MRLIKSIIMKKLSFLPRVFNIIGIILILASLILIVVQLIILENFFGEYVASVCFIGILLLILSKGDEDIKYRAVFISAILCIIVKILTFPLSNMLSFIMLYIGIEYMTFPILFLSSYLILKYSNKQKA